MLQYTAAVGALLSLRYLGNQNLALLSSGIAGTYAASGWYMQQGDRETGYRLGGAASLALLATFTPRLWQSYLKNPLGMDPISNSMVTLGAFHGVHCLLNVGYMNKVRGK